MSSSPGETERQFVLISARQVISSNRFSMFFQVVPVSLELAAQRLQIGQLHPGPCSRLPGALSPKPVHMDARSVTFAD